MTRLKEPVIANIVCRRKLPMSGDQVQLTFGPDYLSRRNRDWAKYIPALSLSLLVVPSIAERFEPGAGYTLTFDESD